MGLTGEERAIKAAQSTVNLPIAKGAPGYGHATFMLAYSKDNLAHVIYPSGITQGDWTHDLSQLIAENWRRLSPFRPLKARCLAGGQSIFRHPAARS